MSRRKHDPDRHECHNLTVDKPKSLYDKFQDLEGPGKYVAYSLIGLVVGILPNFAPGPLFGAVWIFPVMGLLLSLPLAYQSEYERKHPKRPPPLGPPKRRSPF